MSFRRRDQLEAARQRAADVASTILTERTLTIAQAREEIHAVTGLRPEKSTIYRWIKRGVGGVRLGHVRIGNATLTSAEAINRFIVSRTESLSKQGSVK